MIREVRGLQERRDHRGQLVPMALRVPLVLQAHKVIKVPRELLALQVHRDRPVRMESLVRPARKVLRVKSDQLVLLVPQDLKEAKDLPALLVQLDPRVQLELMELRELQVRPDLKVPQVKSDQPDHKGPPGLKALPGLRDHKAPRE